MAALSTTALTLADWAKRLDPDGNVATIIEMLAQTNQILDDALFIEGNLPVGHQTTVRTGLPDVYFRLINAGVLPSKSNTAQVLEQCAMLEAYSQVDKDLANLGGEGRVQGVRFSEAKAFLEAMSQRMARTFFYGAASSPNEFIGLATRYSSLSATNAQNIINAGGSGAADQTSIWLISWGGETVSGIFPQGSQAGIYHEDLGLETVENAGGVTGALMRAYRDHWQWKSGLCVHDWRYAVRICNIDTGNLVADTTPADLIEKMEQAEELIPSDLGSRAFYMNRTVRRFLRKQVREKVEGGGGITFENYAGKRTMMFGETPIRRVDQLLNTESVVA